MNLFDHNIEKELELYAEYSDFVRRYLADNTKIESIPLLVSQSLLKESNIEIDHIKKGDRWEFIYRIYPIKKEFKMKCMSFVKWKIMKMRNERLKYLGL